MPSNNREYGRAKFHIDEPTNPLFIDVTEQSQVWMSHADTITQGFLRTCKIIGSTEDVKFGAFQFDGEETFGLQFHPEVYHTIEGKEIIEELCDWNL